MFGNTYYDSFKSLAPDNLSQVINPWSWWTQNGFINVNVMASSDRAMEKRIVENVAGYGKQLGRIVDLLSVLRKHLPDDGWDLSDSDSKAIADFDDLARGIAAAKANYAAPTRENVERFIAGLKYLKKQDIKAYEQLVLKLGRELSGKGANPSDWMR